MPDPDAKTPKPPPGHSDEQADKYSVQAHSADLMPLAEVARLWAEESEQSEFAALDKIFQAIGRGEFELPANRREDAKLIPYRETEARALGPVRSVVRLSDGTRVTATQVGRGAQGADGRARAAKELYITTGDLRRWFHEVRGEPVPGKAKTQNRNLTDSSRRKGGSRPKYNQALQQAVNLVKKDLAREGKKLALKPFENWIDDNTRNKNTPDEIRYSFDPPIPDCDDLCFDGQKLTWLDSEGVGHDISPRSLAPYFKRAKAS